MPFKFEKLKIWQMSLDLSAEIHDLSKTFPKDELFVLTSQLKRAADSVTLNITEGCTLQSDVEFRRFLVYANRSALEVVACLYLGKRRNLINGIDFDKLYNSYEKLIAMIQALIRSLE